jgi:hypothetical protein
VVAIGRQVSAVVAAVAGWCGASIARRRSREAALEMIAQGPQQRFIGLRVQPPHAVIFFFLFDQPEPSFPRLGIEQQHTNIDPFIAQPARGVAHDAVHQQALGSVARYFIRRPCPACFVFRHIPRPIDFVPDRPPYSPTLLNHQCLLTHAASPIDPAYPTEALAGLVPVRKRLPVAFFCCQQQLRDSRSPAV